MALSLALLAFSMLQIPPGTASAIWTRPGSIETPRHPYNYGVAITRIGPFRITWFELLRYNVR